jgi:uncharacterized membrane protein
MSISLLPFAILWVILASAVIVLIVRRKMVASHEDDTIHMNAAGPAISDQVAVAGKLEQIDKWGKLLTVITVALGLLVAAAYVYQFWVNSAQINPGR